MGSHVQVKSEIQNKFECRKIHYLISQNGLESSDFCILILRVEKINEPERAKVFYFGTRKRLGRTADRNIWFPVCV